jgi:hypothetical protein
MYIYKYYGVLWLRLTVAQERQVTDLVAITPQQRALWVNGLKQVCSCGFV